MPHYLCIDGGGTKTSATVAYLAPSGGEPIFARGEAGPSNLTFGLDVCLSATTEAVANALTTLAVQEPAAALVWPPRDGDTSTSFERVWAGYAGCARPPDRALLFPHLAPLFGHTLRLTGDAELLVSPLMAPGVTVDAAVTLICGTGSLALLWRRDGQSVAQAARSGGWGSLLGDEGSGWSLGKEAVKSVLTFSANARPLREWHKRVLAHFGIDDANRLIAACAGLDAGMPAALADSERKRRIAACTRIAIGAAAEGDDDAMRIVRKVAAEVVVTLEPLVSSDLGGAVVDKTMLVVAGGLGQVDVFWDQVAAIMESKGWSWAQVVKLADPGMSGLLSLLPSHQQ